MNVSRKLRYRRYEYSPLCQIISFQRNVRPVSQIFQISPQKQYHCIHQFLHHQASQIRSLQHHYIYFSGMSLAYLAGFFQVSHRVSVNFISHVSSCLGLQGEETRKSYPMSITWASDIADSALIQDKKPNPINQQQRCEYICKGLAHILARAKYLASRNVHDVII